MPKNIFISKILYGFVFISFFISFSSFTNRKINKLKYISLCYIANNIDSINTCKPISTYKRYNCKNIFFRYENKQIFNKTMHEGPLYSKKGLKFVDGEATIHNYNNTNINIININSNKFKKTVNNDGDLIINIPKPIVIDGSLYIEFICTNIDKNANDICVIYFIYDYKSHLISTDLVCYIT